MRLTKEQVDAIPAKIDKGEQCKDIAAEYGVSRTAISYWVGRFRKEGREIKIKKGFTL